MYRVWYCLQFLAAPEGLEPYPLWIREMLYFKVFSENIVWGCGLL